MTELLSIREAQQKIVSVVKKRNSEICSVADAYNRVLAQDIQSPLNLPPFSNSAMDGFAVYSKDTLNAASSSPVCLPVKMDIPAGHPKVEHLTPGTAARILTGASIPSGADAVVPVENTDQNATSQTVALPESVEIFSPIKFGDNVRPAGQDVKSGQQVLTAGRILQPQDIGLLVSLGIRQVQVMPQPRIALFSSGDELLTPDQPLTPGKIYDSNGFVLAGLLKKAGAQVIQLGIANDNPQSVLDTLDKALLNPPDLIISSAGVSVGVFDYVRQVIEENGALSFWRVNMRPGKPIAFGFYKNIPFLGLPGNPVSAYIGCTVFALPVIRHLMGIPPFAQKTVKAVLTEPLESPDGRESFYRGNIYFENGAYQASLTGHQGSGNLFSLVQANALLIVPAGVKMIPAGEEVSAWTLDYGLD
ncbi:MAG: gephyrin-like molybdotransferase Glp [Leptolinea sp.]